MLRDPQTPIKCKCCTRKSSCPCEGLIDDYNDRFSLCLFLRHPLTDPNYFTNRLDPERDGISPIDWTVRAETRVAITSNNN